VEQAAAAPVKSRSKEIRDTPPRLRSFLIDKAGIKPGLVIYEIGGPGTGVVKTIIRPCCCRHE